MKKFVIGALALLATPAVAHADSNWFRVSTSDDRTAVMYADSNSLIVDGSLRNIWTSVKQATGESKDYWGINCSRHTYWLVAYTQYNRYGRVSSGATVPYYQRKEEFITPDTFMDNLASVVC